MKPTSGDNARARAIVLTILGLLVAVVIAHLAIGLPLYLLYGLGGGLIFCLIIVGRDRLLDAQRSLDKPRSEGDETGKEITAETQSAQRPAEKGREI